MSTYRLPLSVLAGSILLATNAYAAQPTSSTETMVVTAWVMNSRNHRSSKYQCDHSG